MSDLIDRFAPDFTLPTANGGRLSLSELRGQPVVLVFWSATCAWSRRADVLLIYRQLKWAPRGVRIAAVASHPDEPARQILLEAESRSLKFPIALDNTQSVARSYRIETVPHFFLIDAVGMVRYAGAVDDATPEETRPTRLFLDDAVSALIEGLPVPVPSTSPVGCPLPLLKTG